MKDRQNAATTGLAGVIAASATPFKVDGTVEHEAFQAHAHQLLDDGCHVVSPFGTTGEAALLSAKHRVQALEALIKSGIPRAALLPGVGASALSDTLALTRHACELGVAGILVLPSYFYANAQHDGLVNYLSPIIEVAKANGVEVILYNIPQFSGNRITPTLVEELRGRFGETVSGVKDSSGDWEQTSTFLDIGNGLKVFPGSEALLPKAVPLGAAGCISGSVNVTARPTRTLLNSLLDDDSDSEPLAQTVREFREPFEQAGLIPAVKAALNRRYDDSRWERITPPLTPLDEQVKMALFEALGALEQSPN